MKGWIKGMLIGAGACVAAGSMMCVGAWAMGGRFSYYRNRSFGMVEQWTDDDTWDEDLEEAVAYEESAVTGQGGGGDGTGKSGSGTKGEASANALGGTATEARSGGTIVRELEIQVIGGWVEVVADDFSDQIVVTSGNEDYQCRQELDEDKLEIYVGLNSGLWQDWLRDRKDVDFSSEEEPAARIVIPGGAVFRQVDLEVKGGGLGMSQVTARKLNLELDAGSLKVSEGNVEKLDGECRAGELIFQGQVGQEMEAECLAGSIQYLIQGEPEDFSYEVESAAGSIMVDGKELGIINRKKENTIDNSGAEKKAKLECKAGAIDVRFQ